MERTALYRFFNADERLLYVGITSHLTRRLTQHAEEKPWWSDVARVDVMHFDDRESAHAAERNAISTEEPIYNVVRYAGAQSRERCPKLIVAAPKEQLGYGDWCDGCQRAERPDDWTRYPHALEIYWHEWGVVALYRCRLCCISWDCWWTLDWLSTWRGDQLVELCERDDYAALRRHYYKGPRGRRTAYTGERVQ